MAPSLRALLAGIVDYAGLFPPAQLPLDAALRHYARYRTEPEAWMLARFVIPAAKLHEIEPHAEILASGAPFAFSVLARGGADADAWIDGLADDLEAVAAFRARHDDRVVVDVLEAKLPDALLGPDRLDELCDLLTHAVDLINEDGPPSLAPFYEPARRESWREDFAALGGALAATNTAELRRGRERCRVGGFKLRCGGADPAAYPSPEQVAFALLICRETNSPFKATAGLHHPVRHFNAAANATMHGFLNVFGAGVLGQALKLNEAEMAAVVADEDPARFSFDGELFRWRERAATRAQVEAARSLCVSFGSCSFDEPRDDLKKLNLLD
ncbi:MAG: hypothetical protein HS116_19410 [Planctomycetes bacterium]|nr:hypothetical protein [Planctomycetota bacterium]